VSDLVSSDGNTDSIVVVRRPSLDASPWHDGSETKPVHTRLVCITLLSFCENYSSLAAFPVFSAKNIVLVLLGVVVVIRFSMY